MPNQKPPRHLFLTGEKKVGKSTLFERSLSALPTLRLGGFRTVKVADVPGTFGSVYLVPAVGGEAEYSERTRVCLRVPGGNGPLSYPAVFEAFGADTLLRAGDYDLILMDEIGIAEAEAPRFCAAVESVLNGPVPVFGVLRLSGDTPLQCLIRSHPEVELIEVTKENRDALADLLPQMLASRLKSIDTEE